MPLLMCFCIFVLFVFSQMILLNAEWKIWWQSLALRLRYCVSRAYCGIGPVDIFVYII